MLDDIVCSLSGITPSDDEVMADMPPESGWIPVGWLKVTVERKFLNPQWLKLQALKHSLIETTLQQVPEEHRVGQRENVEVQVDAQYSQLEQNEKYKSTIIDKEVAYIAPPESDEEIMEEYVRLLDLLGLDNLDEESEEGEEIVPEETKEVEEEPAGKEEEKSAS
jgi:hypothetical protein